MIELRWVNRAIPDCITEIPPYAVKIEKVLQYREIEKKNGLISQDGRQFFGEIIMNQTDWQDVPVVEE